MPRPKFLIAIAAAFALALIGLSLAVPTAAACALVQHQGLQKLEQTLIEPDASEQDRARFLQLATDARARITRTFGAPHAPAELVFLQRRTKLWPLASVGSFGSTLMIGTRACVIIGPKGQSVDVVAHELMHAELLDRVGFWGRLTRIPVWFDEGVGMQVDYRPDFNLPQASGEALSQTGPQTDYVRRLKTVHQFSDVNTHQLIWNYVAAKAEVARWLAAAGPGNLYPQLQRIRNGETLEKVLQQ